jgi:hypothetical protein
MNCKELMTPNPKVCTPSMTSEAAARINNSRQVWRSRKNSESTVAVPRLRSDTAYLSSIFVSQVQI